MDKRRFFRYASAVFCVLLFVATALVLYISSPSHPKNITDKTVVENGAEYTIKLNGIRGYDEKGFVIAADGFFYTGEKASVYTDDKGFARTTYEGEGETYVTGKYNSDTVLYENYIFCGESYKNQKELEAFFEIVDPIYNFDINKFSEYVNNVLQYKKRFIGKATVKIHRGRCVITEIYIGDEKVLEFDR